MFSGFTLFLFSFNYLNFLFLLFLVGLHEGQDLTKVKKKNACFIKRGKANLLPCQRGQKEGLWDFYNNSNTSLLQLALLHAQLSCSHSSSVPNIRQHMYLDKTAHNDF